MYVLGGLFAGRPLKTPKNSATRPTTSKVKKAIFDICMHEIEGALFLDLFAGSGQVGIEAISRGAGFTYFVENEKNALTALKTNIKNLKIGQKTGIFGLSVSGGIRKLMQQDLCFDLIYLDPPYGCDAGIEALKKLDTSGLFHPKSRIFLEESSKFCPIELKNLTWIKSRRYGSVTLYELNAIAAH